MADVMVPMAKRILVVDDEESLLVPLRRYFEKLGWFVVTALEREEAEAILEHDRFDIVILDLALTRLGLEGLDVLHGVRQGCPGTPILILSGFTMPWIQEEALRRGASAVLCKPQPLGEIARVALELMTRTA